MIILVLYMPSPLHWSRYICNMLSRVTYMWYTWMLSSLPYCSCIYTNKLSVYMLNCILYLQLILLWKVHCNVNFVDIDACCPVLVCMVLFDLSYVVAAYFIPPPPPPPQFLWTFYFQLKLSSKQMWNVFYICHHVWERDRGEKRGFYIYISEVHGIKQAEVNRKCSSSTGYIVYVIKETQESADISFTWF